MTTEMPIPNLPELGEGSNLNGGRCFSRRMRTRDGINMTNAHLDSALENRILSNYNFGKRPPYRVSGT